MRSRTSHTRVGFTLLTTLLLLVALISVTARLSTLAATETISTQRRLNSLHHELAADSAVFKLHEEVRLEQSPSSLFEELQHVGVVEKTWDLCGCRCTAWIQSDAAKLQPSLWQHPGQESILTRKLTMLQQRYALTGRLKLQPTQQPVEGPRYHWFDQLLTDASPESFFRWDGHPHSATPVWSDFVTFWGDGRIDLRYAQIEVLEAVLEDLGPGLAQPLFTARSSNKPAESISSALASLPSDVRSEISRRMTWDSKRVSIRLQTALGADRRQWYLVVSLGGEQPTILHRSQLTW